MSSIDEQTPKGIGSMEVDAEDVDPEMQGLTGGISSRKVAQASLCTNIVMFLTVVGGFIIVISLTSATYSKVKDQAGNTYVTYTYDALGLPGYSDYSWADVTTAAFGTTVNYCYWQGDEQLNHWVDDIFKPGLLERYNIKLNILPECATASSGWAISEMQAEKAAGNTTNGMVDLTWVNGPNFKIGSMDNLWYGPWANKVPSSVNFDFQDDDIAYDFGWPTNQQEMPYNKAQFVFFYNSAACPGVDKPETLDDLYAWIQANSEKFTYANPASDFHASAYIRHGLYNADFQTNPWQEMLGSYNEDIYSTRSAPLLQKLRELAPYMYKVDGNPYYPASGADTDTLFTNGEICLTFSYQTHKAGAKISAGIWPETVIGYLLTSNTLANVNFHAVGKNAANALGGVVAANYAAECASMFTRSNPATYNKIQTFDPTSVNFVEGGWSVAFEYLRNNSSPYNPSEAALFKYEMAEVVGDYKTALNSDWVKCVGSYTGDGSDATDLSCLDA